MKVKDYISEKQTECLKAVQKINNEQHDKVGWDHHCNLLSMSICSYYFSVTLDINNSDFHAEIQIYNSENDDRIYFEKSDKYENWYPYIKRKLIDIKFEINDIKL